MKRWLSENRWGVILTGLIITAMPIIGLTLYVRIQTAGYIRDDVIKEDQQSAIFVSERIKDALSDEIRLGNLLVTRPGLKAEMKRTDREKITSHLKAFIDNSITIDRAFITNSRGIMLADYPSDPSVLDMDFSRRDWYKGVSRNWHPYVSEFYLRTAKPQRYLFAIAIPIRADDKSIIGILVLQPEVNYLKNILAHVPVQQNQITYVVDKNGNLIYHSKYMIDKAINISGFTAVQRLRKGLTGVETFLNPDGQRILTAYRNIEEYGWGVVVERPEKEVFGPLKEVTFGLSVFASIMLLIGGYFAYKRSALIYSLRKFSEELETRVDKRTDELKVANTQLSLEIEERREATELLLKSEKKLKDITSFLAEGIYVLNEQGNIIFMNPEAERLLGWSVMELMNKNAHDVVHYKKTDDSLLPFEECNLHNVMKTGISFVSRDEVFIRKDGTTFPISVVSSPIMENDKVVGAVTAFRDITERKRIEDKLKETRDKLEAANKELEAFSYSVSHDLRAPLRHASGFVKLLQKRLKDNPDEKIQHYGAMIEEASKRMERLIDDLLAFSRIGRSEMQKRKVGFTALVREVAREIQDETKPTEPTEPTEGAQAGAQAGAHAGAHAGRDIVWEVDELPEVYGDQSLLRLALVNLISNAVKYTGTRTRAEIKIGYKDEGDEFIFFVKDNGVGFDMKYADRLFGVFQRLHTQDEFEGTGIGLANVRRIISRHGGRTWAEGSVGQGAVFYFTLPKTKEI